MAFRFNTPPGIVFGDLLVTGDLTVEGSSTVEVDSTVLGDMDIQGQLIIDTDNVEAFLVRADGDGGDVFAVDTINDLAPQRDPAMDAICRSVLLDELPGLSPVSSPVPATVP